MTRPLHRLLALLAFISAGNQVPAGTYFMGDLNGIEIQVGAAETAVTALGAPKIGTNRSLQICSPQDPGAPYLLFASGASSPGFNTCAGTIPLRRDRLFQLSMRSPNVFQGFRGNLDGAGASTQPSFAIPDTPSLLGTSISFAFVVLDPGAPCRIKRISVPQQLTIF